MKNEAGRTALHLAAAAGKTIVVNSLLNQGADISVIDNAGNTPLHLACKKHQFEVIKVLLAKTPRHFDYLLKNQDNNTPYMEYLAAQKKHHFVKVAKP